MIHWLRKAYELSVGPFDGPVKVDETFIGDKRRNMPKSKRKTLTGPGTSGKTAVVGMEDRDTNGIK
ncbi:MAG: hypothetical protein OXI87_17360 [Albidovulum sp.]|nr:hypothetical protein [Albidovulum sp.]MDE0530491.1 hypothetical protein [Albidovulum sp.]